MDIVPANIIILRRIYSMQNENKKGFQVRDLIVTALLSVCALVIYIVCAVLSFSPYTMLVPIVGITGSYYILPCGS